MRATHGLLLSLLVPMASCAIDRSVTTVVSELPRPVAFLVASVPSPEIGSDVTITAQLQSGLSRAVAGSFGVELRYDPLALRYVGEERIDDNLRAVSSVDVGRLRIAGASLDGFSNGRLCAARFTVLRAGALSTLQLAVDQLGTVLFQNQTAMLSVRSRYDATLQGEMAP